MEQPELHINVTVNGQTRSLDAGQSRDDLLRELQLDSRMVVVEHHRVLVRRPPLAAPHLDDGDNVELVHFVGGG